MNKAILFLGVVVFVVFVGILIFNQSRAPKEAAPTNQLSNLTTGSPSPASSPTPTVDSNLPATVTATIKTEKGDIVLSLDTKSAPRTVANFVQKSKTGFYKNLTFHRVEDWVIQGGDPLGTGMGGKAMPTELNDKPFITGAIGVARGGDIKVSNDSQFFILKKDASYLNKLYTNFGSVQKGMDVANQIQIGDKILDVTVE